ncbi:MAG: GNAT family N-acetyltransferase [Microthrixaceae bacterium]
MPDSPDSPGPNAPSRNDLTIRRATPADRPAVIELCRASLGWKQGDPNEGFFEWKHDRNPFGVSPAWVAASPEGQIVGLRVFLRWEFDSPAGAPTSRGSTTPSRSARGRITAVRAVDTATHPDWQGKGIFTKLTLGALDELKGDGLDVVFNTPNDQSRPGYLKMGWQTVGRVPVGVQVRSVTSAARLRGARAAAEKWSAGATAGVDARETLADAVAVQRLLDRLSPVEAIHTPRTVEYLQWRYDFEPLGYRALPLGDSLDAGLILFRVRARGTAKELTVCDVLAPKGAKVNKAIRYLLRSAKADYAIAATGPGSLRAGFVPLNRLGPILVWREVNREGIPTLDDLAFSLGDIELF